MSQEADGGVLVHFSMEISLEAAMPTYSGGLGGLAEDTVRAAAEEVPSAAVMLLHRKGFFHQKLAPDGAQSEEAEAWPVAGLRGNTLPVYFLDAELPESEVEDRTLTHFLYGGDARYRRMQEEVLGIGAARMLKALGHGNVRRCHMNEGHSSLLTPEHLDESAQAVGRTVVTHADVEAVGRRCVFTTHTPVPAALDQFPLDFLESVLGQTAVFGMNEVFCVPLDFSKPSPAAGLGLWRG